MRKKSAFSLIELMVVIAIVAVLAAVAMPAYKSYRVKSEIMKVIPLMEMFKKGSIEYYNLNGSWPTQMGQLGIPGVTSTVGNTSVYNYVDSSSPYPISNSFLAQDSPTAGCAGAAENAGIYCIGVRLDATAIPELGSDKTLVFTVSGTDPLEWKCTTDSSTSRASDSLAEEYLPAGCLRPTGPDAT